MSEEAGSVKGPDLAAGVPFADLEVGRPVFGHVGDDSVFVIRNGDEDVHAFAAKCTHYGGPLREGLQVGPSLRCPLHHARFSLEDGRVEGGPAHDALARYAVTLEDGRVRVGKRTEIPPLSPRRSPSRSPDNVVIVGAGAAGISAAETLRQEGYEGPIHLVDPDPDAPYDRPNLSKAYLSGDAPEEWMPLRSREFLEEHQIHRVVDRVREVHLTHHRVLLGKGDVLPFGALLLATGSRPRRLKVPGADLPHVHTLRTLEDSRRIIAAAEQAEKAVVVGASFIGMEVAASLRSRGLEVTVVAPDEAPFAATLGSELGSYIRSLHEEKGVRFRLGRTLREIREGTVILDDDSTLVAEMVVVGIGVDPDVALAREAGLEVEDGIVVDEELRSSHPDVFAAGDVASYPEPRLGTRVRVEHWVPSGRQGRTAARNILGLREPFRDVPFFWTRHFGTSISYVGHAQDWDEAVRVGECPGSEGCAVSLRHNGERRALATVRQNRRSLTAEARMEEGPEVDLHSFEE